VTVTPVADRANDDSLFFRDDSVDMITLSERLNDFSHSNNYYYAIIFVFVYYTNSISSDL